MVEKYFAIKLIGEFIVSGLLIIAGITVIAVSVIRVNRQNRKIKLLEKNGFEKYLRGVPAMGNGAFYGWKRSSDRKIISDVEIEYHSYSELKKWIDGGSFK